MDVVELAVPGALELRPVVHGDERGSFAEWYRAEVVAAAVGWTIPVAQANVSVSRRGVVRGVHYAELPPSQAKYVTCLAGEVLDVVVDLRVGSPAYGRWASVRLDEASRRAVYLPEGVGHAFCALSASATVAYLCSEPYRPGREHAVHALDPELGLPWPAGVDPVLSPRDAAAPSLAEARAAGLLPTWEAYVSFVASRSGTARVSSESEAT